MRQQTAGTWGPWQPLGGVFNSGPAVTTTAGDGLVVAGVGADSALWVRVRTGSAWSAWHRVVAAINADPALTVTPGGNLLAVVRGSDNAGWVSVGDPAGTSWSHWLRIGGALASAPTVVVVGSTATVFAVGTNGRIYETSASDASTGSGWTGWRALP